MPWQKLIAIDAAVLAGKPLIKGTRLAVKFILDLMAEGWTHEQIGRNYPALADEDLQTTLQYAVPSL